MMKIKAYISDLGGVLVDHDFNKAIDSFGRHFSLTGEEVEKIYDIFNFKNDLVKSFHCGLLEPYDFYLRFCEALKIPIYLFKYKNFKEYLNSIFYFSNVERNIDMIKKIKSQVEFMIIASNINEIHLSYLREEIPQLFELFDYCIFSCRIGFLKPENLFWEEIKRRLYCMEIGLEECIFVDDVQENVLGAVRFGFSNVFWYSGDDKMDRLKKFLSEFEIII